MPYFDPKFIETIGYWVVYALLVAFTFVILAIVGWLVIKAMDLVTTWSRRPALALVAPIVGVVLTLGLDAFVNYRILGLDSSTPLIVAGILWFLYTLPGLKVAWHLLTHLDELRASVAEEVERYHHEV